MEDTTPLKVQRRKLISDAPAFTSSWRLGPDHIDGHIEWQQCEREISWTTRRVRVSRTTGTRNGGAVLISAATVVTAITAATYPKPEKHCSFYGACTFSSPDTTLTKVLAASGLALLVGGVVMLAVGDRAKVETFPDEPGQARSTGPCISPRELPELVLVLRVGRNLWPIRLEKSGDVRVLVPEGARVPEGVDLEVVVFRAPADVADLPLIRGQVLETLRLDAAPKPAEATPAEAEGRAD
jgi:hypothetical protein